MKHRGEIIAKYIIENDVNKTKLAKKILFGGKNKTARTMYNKLSEPNLSLDDVLSFSEALKHDFSDEIPELRKFIPQDFHFVSQTTENTSKEDVFKEKYYELLEQQNELLRNKDSSYQKLAEALIKLAVNFKKSAEDAGTDIKETLLNNSKDLNESLMTISRILDSK